MLHFLYVGHFVHEGDFIRFDRQPDGGLRPVIERPLSVDAIRRSLRRGGVAGTSIPEEWGVWQDDGFIVCDAVTHNRDAIEFIRDLANETGCDLADYTSQLFWSPEQITETNSSWCAESAARHVERIARIEWLSAEQGGRNAPPSGPRYSTPVRFESQPFGAEGATWSLVVEMIDRSADAMAWTARVHFLMDEAPNELLNVGARFELFEGAKRIGRGAVLPETVGANAATQAVVAPQLN